MKNQLIRSGAILAATAVILGAMGAHALERLLEFDQLDAFKTGVRYQMYHALAMMILAAVSNLFEAGRLKMIYRLMLSGVILFSGSIYLLSTSSLGNMNLGLLGPITPIGGTLMIISWIMIPFSLKKED